MAKKKIEIDELLEEKENETAQKKITKIEEKKIVNDVKDAVSKGDVSFSKVKIYAIKDGEEYFVNEFPYDDEIVKDPEAWIKKRVLAYVPKKYRTDTFKIKVFTPDNALALEKEVKVIVEDIEEEINTAITEQVKGILDLSNTTTQYVLQNMMSAMNKTDSKDELVKEMIRLLEDTIKSLKEEKERIIEEVRKEKEREGKSETELIYELVKIEKTFDEKIEKLYELERKLMENKGDTSSQLLIELLTKLIDRLSKDEEKVRDVDPVEEMTKVMEFVEKIMAKQDNSLQEKLIEVLTSKEENDPVKEQLINIALSKLMEDKKEDPIEELEKQLTLIAKLKEVFGGKEEEDNTNEVTLMLIQKLEEMEKKYERLIEEQYKKKEEKDEFERLIEFQEKLERLKRFYDRMTGGTAKPIKSFVELIVELLNSPVVENIGRIIADAMVKQEMIRQGYYIEGDKIIVLPRLQPQAYQGFQGAYGYGYPYPAPPQPIYQQQPVQQFNDQQVQQNIQQQIEQHRINEIKKKIEEKKKAVNEGKTGKDKAENEVEEAKNKIKEAMKNVVEVTLKEMKKKKIKKDEIDKLAEIISEKIIEVAQDKEVANAIFILAKTGNQKFIEEEIDRCISEDIGISEDKKSELKEKIVKKLNRG